MRQDTSSCDISVSLVTEGVEARGTRGEDDSFASRFLLFFSSSYFLVSLLLSSPSLQVMAPSPLLARALSALLLFSSLAAAAPITPTLTAPSSSAPTPAMVLPPRPLVLPLEAFAPRFPGLAGLAPPSNDTTSLVAREMLDGVNGGEVEKRATRATRVRVTPQVQAAIAQTCLDSSVSLCRENS